MTSSAHNYIIKRRRKHRSRPLENLFHSIHLLIIKNYTKFHWNGTKCRCSILTIIQSNQPLIKRIDYKNLCLEKMFCLPADYCLPDGMMGITVLCTAEQTKARAKYKCISVRTFVLLNQCIFGSNRIFIERQKRKVAVRCCVV